MFNRIKQKIQIKISNILRSAVKSELEGILPIIPQLIAFQNSSKEDKQSFYDHTKHPLEYRDFYEGLKDRLLAAGVPVESVKIDILDFERWLNDFTEIRWHYKNMADVFIEKCLEHYLAYRYLNISDGDVYIDVASAGSPWADVLNSRGGQTRGLRTLFGGQKARKHGTSGIKAYRLDLAYPEGIRGINIGVDAGDTKLPKGFASVLSLQCAFECFMGDADIRFVKEAGRVLNERGSYGIIPLYLEDEYFVSTSPFCDQSGVRIEAEAKRVWRDDEYRAPFSRHYSPEAFSQRIYSAIPEDMEGRIIYFENLNEIMLHYPGQRIYCFFMFLSQKV